MLICRITPFEEHYNIDLKMENIINGKIIASSSQVVDQNIIDIINSMPPMIIDLISQQYPDSKIENKVPNVPIRSRKIKENINSNSKSTVKIEKGPIQNIVSDEKSLIVITTFTNISINNDVYSDLELFNEVFDYPYWAIKASYLSPENNLLIAGLEDGTICLWNTKEWGSPYQYNFYNKSISAISVSKSILSVSYIDGNTDFIDINSLELQYRKRIANNEIKFIFPIDGGFIFISSYSSISMFNIKEKQILLNLPNYNVKLRSASISSDNKLLALGYSDGKIKLYRVGSSINPTLINGKWEKPYIRFQQSFQADNSIISIDFSASDDLIACLQEDDRVKFLDILNNNIYNNLKLDTQQDDKNIIKFIDDYAFIIGSINGNLYLHELK